MFKLKEAYLEGRNIFAIDDKGKIHKGFNYHGDIVFKFDYLHDTAEGIFGSDKNIKAAAKVQDKKLMDIILESGFILGGIWKPSKRQLYIIWYKPTNKAIIGLIKKISTYNPTAIYVEDLNRGTNKLLDNETFIEEYL